MLGVLSDGVLGARSGLAADPEQISGGPCGTVTRLCSVAISSGFVFPVAASF